MRIAINTRFLLKGKLEGIGWCTYEVVKSLVANHPEHEFIFFFDRPYDETYIFGENVEAVVLNPPARHAILWYAWFEWAIPKALKKYKADVFYSPDGYCSLRTEVPTVMVMHDLAYLHYPEQVAWAARKYYQQYIPKFLQRAEKTITVSAFTKSDILKHFDIRESQIEVVHNACREGFAPLNDAGKQLMRNEYSNGVPYFFYVGAVHPRKNVERLIRAFDLFKQKSKAPEKLLITGRLAWQTEAVKQAWQQSPYQQDIIFPGYVDDLGKLMAGAKALVYVSLFEGFGLPILEAMHCDVPVITANLSSMPEVAGEAALLVDPLSETEIASAMQLLYEDEEKCRVLVNKGQKQRQKFSWDKAAEQIWKAIISVKR